MNNQKYRGWDIDCYQPPVPFRNMDWQATHPDFDGDEDSRYVHAGSLEDLQSEIDLWIGENEN